jgi:hypothetical protein
MSTPTPTRLATIPPTPDTKEQKGGVFLSLITLCPALPEIRIHDKLQQGTTGHATEGSG